MGWQVRGCTVGLGGSGICRFLFHIYMNKLALVLKAVRWGTRCCLECLGCPRRTSSSAEIGLGHLRNRPFAVFDFIKRFLP